ncbi:MAG: hypothetical protein RJA61_705 [Candidatus Parcubacteria bacterium]|jgi:phosphoribosyl 1,2-cyclic phosphodiesterase
MKITFWGTRGSVPIFNIAAAKTGGNTTCVEVESDFLPKHTALAIDAGTGYLPFSTNALQHGVKEVHTIFSHHHHDHTQGFLLSPITFNKAIPVTCWGPVEAGMGPRDVFERLMAPPFFPVDFSQVASHLTMKPIKSPNTAVIVTHPTGGVTMLGVEQFERAQNGNAVLPFGQKGRFPKSECMVIRMFYSNHPERTICYRFEEPTGKVFVFLTDHENQDAMSQAFKRHIGKADLLVMDSQYLRKTYDTVTAGFGHGTADFCVRTAFDTGAKKLGLTHHDPMSTDETVEKILEEGLAFLEKVRGSPSDKGGVIPLSLSKNNVFLCRDYQSIEL